MTRRHLGPADQYGVSVGAFGLHDRQLADVAWSPDGATIVTVGDGRVSVWDTESLDRLTSFGVPGARRVTFSGDGSALAVGDWRGIGLWRADGYKPRFRVGTSDRPEISFADNPNLLAYSDTFGARLQELSPPRADRLTSYSGLVRTVEFDSFGRFLAVGGEDGVEVLDAKDGSPLWGQMTHVKQVLNLAYSADGRFLAVGSADSTVAILNTATGRLVTSLEGHSAPVASVDFSHDSGVLASLDTTGRVILWDSSAWRPLHGLDVGAGATWAPRMAFHPSQPLLATIGVVPTVEKSAVLLWEVDVDRIRRARPSLDSVTYASVKIVLVGESGVGKTGLGYRLAHGEFREQPSTHGQQFWLLDQLAARRSDGAECEAVLWDLAGQPDYRLIHALFLEDADLALIVFDPTRDDDPLRGVDYWLQHLRAVNATAPCEVILVAARSDRGAARLTTDEIERFCVDRKIRAYVVTSALDETGLEQLLVHMRAAVDWETRPTSVTTTAFKRIKDAVLTLKDSRTFGRVVFSTAELRARVQSADREQRYTDAEILGATGHLANHGYVSVLRDSHGAERVLVRPEVLNNLAASIVLEARRNPHGLGSLEEAQLMSGAYSFPELETLADEERDTIADSAVAMFLAHNVCFRETDPLTNRVFLVFPDLINLRRPLAKGAQPLVEGTAYTVQGAVENVYASLVVMLGYTKVFTRTNQWRDQAEYVCGQDQVCGFRLEEEREGELDLVLSYGDQVPESTRMLFQGLFESFLHRQGVTVSRLEPVTCSNDHQLNRAVVRELTADGNDKSFCTKCGEELNLRRGPVLLLAEETADLDQQRHAATQRSRFEEAIFRLTTFVDSAQPSCFISYAWGDDGHERWVEKELAADLSKAGIEVILDRWANARIGASVPRFLEQIANSDRVVVVGSPAYRRKYENHESMGGFVLAAEGDLIGHRMIGSEARKETVLPIVVDGTPEQSLPALLRGRVHADFTAAERYFIALFDLILTIHGRSARDPEIAGLRELLTSS